MEGKEYTLANDRTFETDPDLVVEVTSNTATNKTTSSAHLSASYSIVHNGVSKAPTNAGFCWSTATTDINRESANTVVVSAPSGSFAHTLTGLSAGTTYHWKAWVEYDGETKYTSARSFTTDNALVVKVTANTATNKTTSGAYLTASYTSTYNGSRLNPTVVGFCWGTTSGTIKRGNDGVSSVEITASAAITGESFYRTLTGLNADKTYYWKAWVEVSGTTYYSDERQFTTESTVSTTPALGKSWLEMPAEMNGYEATMATSSTANLFTHTFYYSSTARNYTVCYDKSAMTTLWVAYPLGSEHRGSGRSDAWAYVDSSLLPTSCQANVKAGSFYSASGTNNYDKGHLVPSGSRNKSLEDMNKQTFLPVNIAPQNATFNQKTWANLESALQSLADSGNYLYIVTGTMCKQASDGNGSFSLERTYDKDGKEIPVPKYFYKVVLRVNNTNSPTSASAIGFWFTNTTHSDSYTNYVRSVDEIEALTGLNFFVNLKDDLEVSAEKNTSWSSFQGF